MRHKMEGRATVLHPSLYEQAINQQLDSELSRVSESCKATASADKAEASKVFNLISERCD